MADDPKVGEAKPVDEINYTKIPIAVQRIRALIAGDGSKDADWERLRRLFSLVA